MIGQTVSHYRILEKLGAGGMGVVYKAEDTRLKRTVALKFLPPELTRDDNAKTRFMHEAQAASALQHHNICAIHEIDETPDGQLFISMDCYEGETLKERIAKGPLPVEEAVDIASQVAAGLSKAHEAGMVHRDIKPANIIVTNDGVVKILDFGLAKLAGMTKLTKTGMTVGTVAYMSPEQAKGEESDARSDIWSLGAVLYEMLTGKVPFPGEHEAAVLYGIMNSEPKPLAEFDKNIPQELQGIIDRALKKDPKERCENVLDLQDDLDAVGAGGGESGKKRRRLTRRPQGARGRVQARRILVAATIIIVVVAAVVIPRLWRLTRVTEAHALAVMDFRDLATPDDPTVSAGITEFTNIGLIQADVVRVVSGDLLHDLRRRLFGSPRGTIEESQTLEIARKAGATLFLTGTIRPSDAGKLVTWHLVDTRSGDDVKAGRLEGNELAPLVDQMLAETLPLIADICGVKIKNALPAVENFATASPVAYQHYMAGLLAAQEFRRDDAIAAFERAVAIDSTFALAYFELWGQYRGYFASGKVKNPIEKAWSLRERLGIKDRMRVEAARTSRAGTARSVDILRDMRKRWPDDRQVLIDLRDMLSRRWYGVEALRITEEGLRLFPDDPNIGNAVYVSLLLGAGRSDDAMRVTQSFIARRPTDPVAWEALGDVYRVTGVPDSAAVAYQKAAELDPQRDPYHEIDVGGAYDRGDLEGAITRLKTILEQPSLPANKRFALTMVSHQSQTCLAALYIEAGRYQEMREACREYWVLPLWMVQMRLLTAMGQWQEIIDVTRNPRSEEWAQPAPPDTVSLLYATSLFLPGPHVAGYWARDLGKARAETGDVEGAREIARNLLSLEDLWGRMAIHDANEIQARAALAERDAKTALKILIDMKKNGVPFGGYIDIDYRTTLARAYRMDGRLEDAAAVHKEMLRIYGGHALSHYELGMIYEEMKRPADAKKEYAKFLEMWSEADEGLPQLVDARKRIANL